jgi:serine/threonine-protein kinase
MGYHFQALGPLQAGEGSRAFLGLAISAENRARPVVIIWVPEAAQQDPGLLEKIRRETEHAAKLDHPNIVTVMGFAELAEGQARVVEFADGESLRKVIEVGKQLPPRMAARVIIDACTGVHYAHIAGNDDGSPLVHGDLRPETILISFGGTTKVTGYGALAFAPREIAGQRVKGRRVHSAPEQIIGGREAITIPTDVYLLGLMLYEALTGVVPWADQGDFFDHAVLSLPLPPASPGLIPAALEPVLARACAKKAAERYPTPLALREAIEAAMGTEIATVEELNGYLDSLFPQSHQLRADRRHTIDAGIADFVRRQWAESERRETVPMMRAVQLPPGVPIPPSLLAPVPARPVGEPTRTPEVAKPPAPSKPPTRPAMPAVYAAPGEDDDEEPRAQSGSSTPWVLLLAGVVAVGAMYAGWTKANAPLPPAIERPVTLPPVTMKDAGASALDAGLAEATVDASITVDAGPIADAGARDAGATGDAGSRDDAGAQTAAVAPVDAGEVEVVLTIESTPAVDVLLDGKLLGRTPFQGRLPAGKKTFTLQNKDLLISTTRTITLKADAISEKYAFEKGFVSITAPEGSAIFIDGVRIATAPVKGEIPVYEGYHRIQVLFGQAKWNDTFTLYGGQRVSFNVTQE